MSDYTSQPEPPPVPTTDDTAESMHDRVIELVQKRKEFGLAKYGSTLAAFNGRDPLNDAMDEALDLPCYIEQARVERDAMRAWIDDLRHCLKEAEAMGGLGFRPTAAQREHWRDVVNRDLSVYTDTEGR